jgi:hypothetical protein
MRVYKEGQRGDSRHVFVAPHLVEALGLSVEGSGFKVWG